MKLFALALALLVGCGARTDLERPDAGAWDAARPDAEEPACRRNRDCDDGVRCTRDRCESGRCVHVARDAMCDDSRFCTGTERCDPILDCVSSGDPCDDGIACTEDVCQESSSRCEVVPDPGLCPLSHRCDALQGCLARALVHTSDRLFEVDLPGGELHEIAPLEVSLTDIALMPDGRFFGVTGGSLFTIDERDGRATYVASVAGASVGLDVHPDGGLVAAGSDAVWRVDPDTGRSSRIADFPVPFMGSGDVAFIGGRMFVSAIGVGTDHLLEVLFLAGEMVEVGPIGASCVWGMTPFEDTLYGFTCGGEMLVIDIETGHGEVVADLMGRRIWGAAAR